MCVCVCVCACRGGSEGGERESKARSTLSVQSPVRIHEPWYHDLKVPDTHLTWATQVPQERFFLSSRLDSLVPDPEPALWLSLWSLPSLSYCIFSTADACSSFRPVGITWLKQPPAQQQSLAYPVHIVATLRDNLESRQGKSSLWAEHRAVHLLKLIRHDVSIVHGYIPRKVGYLPMCWARHIKW